MLGLSGRIIGDAHDHPYQGRGFAVHTGPYAGYASMDEVKFVGDHYPGRSLKELNEDYIECVKLDWRFPGLYKMALCKMQEEFRQRGLTPPKVSDPLEYLG